MMWLRLVLVAVAALAALQAWRWAPHQRLALTGATGSSAVPTIKHRRIALGVVGLVGLIGGLVIPVVSAALASRFWVVYRKRRDARTSHSAISAQLAETIDLFAVALSSGHNLTAAMKQVSQWSRGDLGDEVRACLRQVDRGQSLADALEELPARLGSELRPLTHALIAHERFGAPISQTLTRLADDVRASRRRHGETTARQLPVAMLFPLVLCVLPAFVLLTVVPVIADSLADFGLFAAP